MSVSRQARFWVVVGVAHLAIGCSSGDLPPLGQVEGIVTLDGRPLDMCSVVFRPEGEQPSDGFTNSEGHYELRYNQEADGAAVGEHRVTIFDNSGKDRVPKKYNLDSALKATVKRGQQAIDFQLISEP